MEFSFAKAPQLVFLIFLTSLTLQCAGSGVNKLIIYPMPKGEIKNADYKVYLSGKPVPVYNAKVGAADPVRRFKAVDDLLHSADYYDMAAFSYADIEGSAAVKIQVAAKIKSAKILPAALKIKFSIKNNQILFKVGSTQNLTIEINGEIFKSLHLFINPIERNKPNPKDPNVIYFGPGIHEVSSLIVGSNKTVYLAGGAILRAVVGSNEKYTTEPSGLKNYAPTILLMGDNIKFTGRGILDAELCPTHSRNLVTTFGTNISIEGIILRNSSGWTMPVRQSKNVLIKNVKILGYRANTDGIDICNSSNVVVEKCFIRTNDDLIVVKSWENQGKTNHIVVKGCVLWNQLAHALSLGAELRENVNDVQFSDCDIIHDRGREWSLRVFHSDASEVTNIKFDRIRIEEADQLISLWTGKNVSSLSKQLGYIKNITFSNITAKGTPLVIALTGGDSLHQIENVIFNNVTLNGNKLSNKNIERNPFVKNVSVVDR